MKYFAYGSNLNIKQMKWRCQDADPLGEFTLEGFQLVFRYYADIIPVQGKSVKGGLWEISEEDEKILDSYEAFPHLYGKYYKKDIMYYRMHADVRHLELPSLGYLAGMLEGMENFGLSPLEDLNHNLGNEPSDNTKREGDLLQPALQMIADAMGLSIADDDSNQY